MRKYNHALVPGRTIVVGTEQGLHARIARLARPVLRLRSTKDDGMVLEHEYELDEALLAVVSSGGSGGSGGSRCPAARPVHASACADGLPPAVDRLACCCAETTRCRRRLQAAQAGGFWSYATGTAYRLLVDFGVGGLSIDNYW